LRRNSGYRNEFKADPVGSQKKGERFMRKLAIAVALSSTVLATPALARDGALYVGGEFGAMIVEDIDVDIGTRQDAITIDHEYGYDGAGSSATISARSASRLKLVTRRHAWIRSLAVFGCRAKVQPLGPPDRMSPAAPAH
jgi:hypothetical protein